MSKSTNISKMRTIPQNAMIKRSLPKIRIGAKMKIQFFSKAIKIIKKILGNPSFSKMINPISPM
jgi:hypothetical protein